MIRVGLPSYRDINPETVGSIIALEKAMGSELNWSLRMGTDVAPGRHGFVLQMLEHKDDYLLSLDSDMVFLPEDVTKLKEALDKGPEIGALSAFYIKWDGSGLPVHNWLEDGKWMEPARQVAKCA